MALFGKKKEEKERLPAVVENLPEPEFQPEPKHEEHEIKKHKEHEEKPKEEHEKKSYAPLFVKLDRYKQILSTTASLKTSLMMLKNNFDILKQLEKIRDDNMSLVKETLDRVEKRLLSLDSELIRPSGFREEMPEMHDVQTVEATLADLKSQIEQLKDELKTVA